jgi:phosphatidylinositol alpha-mannosyltransferase
VAVPRPLRICVTLAYDLAEEGGVKRHAEHLAEQLRAAGDQVLVVGPYSGARALPPHTTGLAGVLRVRSNGSRCGIGLLVPPWRARRALAGPFDVLHAMEPLVPSLNWYAAWLAPATVRVATFHSYSEREGACARLLRRFGLVQLARFHRGIAVSPAAERFARALWRRPLALIPNGVDTSVFTPPPTRPAAPGEVRLLFVGHWHHPRKGLPVLLDAYTRLRARGVPLRLEVVGDGDRAAPRLPGVTWHAAISDERLLAERYRAADVLVAPSLGSESFGIVLLEAMSSGLGIVCSDIDGYRSVVAPGGARLAPPGDAARLAEAIAEVAGNRLLRRRMGEINRRAVRAYDWASVAARVRDEYLAALEEQPADERPAAHAFVR